MRQPRIRIGLLDFSSTGWTAGRSFTRVLGLALSRACHEAGWDLVLLSADPQKLRIPAAEARTVGGETPLPGEPLVLRLLRRPPRQGARRGERLVRRVLGLPRADDPFAAAAAAKVDVLMPVVDVPPAPGSFSMVGWIPDFQHVHFPQFFSPQECASRDRSWHHMAQRAAMVMLSSQNAASDFAARMPGLQHKARVAPFPSLFAYEPPAGPVGRTLEKFRLPEKYLLVVNQFWAHKNHMTVIRAVSQLASRGLAVPVVMTGMPSDARDPTNASVSLLMQEIAQSPARGHIHVLGLVPEPDLHDLLRSAAAILQPSLCEGWNTTVQDAVALGRPLVCSDIPVLREQAPGALGFFPPEDAGALADCLARHWSGLPAGPDLDREAQALAAHREFARNHVWTLRAICRDALRG